MQRFNREPFNPQAQFACVKPFVMAGVAYDLGQVVDTTAVETRRLRQMYEARMIDALPLQAAPPAQVVSRAAEGPGESRATPGAARAEHRGFGRWFVIASDGAEKGPLTKEAAEALVAA